MRYLLFAWLCLATPVLAAPRPITSDDPLWKQMETWGHRHYQNRAQLTRGELAGTNELGNSDPDSIWLNRLVDQTPDSVDIVLFGIADKHRVIIVDRRNGTWLAKKTRRDSAKTVRIETSDNMHQILNAQLAETRALRAKAITGDRVMVADQVLQYNGYGERGYMVGWFVRQAGIRPNRPQRDTVYLHPSIISTNSSIRVWFRPSVGAGQIAMEPIGFFTPIIGGVGGCQLGQTDVSVYAMEGQDFQPDLKGLCRYGLQLGDELGWAVRFGYQSDWTELRGDGHTDRRREGGEVGITYGAPAFSVSGYFALGWYSDRRDRDGRSEPSLGLGLNFGPIFRINK